MAGANLLLSMRFVKSEDNRKCRELVTHERWTDNYYYNETSWCAIRLTVKGAKWEE
jgi:hypothetical protein